MRPVRVAVQEGAGFVRIAGAGDDGAPWLIAELPASGPGVAALLADLVGPPPRELVLVHPARWPPERAAQWARDCAGLAAAVRTVPAPLAAAGEGEVAVLDVGASTTEATRLDAAGRVRAVAAGEVGGRLLDELVAAHTGRDPAAARAVREALSLLPAVDGVEAAQVRPLLAEPLTAAVAALREVVSGAPRVVLIGGVARTPLLARVVDESGLTQAEVPPRPEAAAVLGALERTLEPHCSLERPETAVRLQAGPYLPRLPARPRRALRGALLGVAAAVGLASLLLLGWLLVPPGAEAVPAGALVQYGYRLDVPAGWEHTGGLPERRRVLLTPVAAPEGSDLIAVERSPLGYDTAAEPQRARAELRAAYDAALREGSAFSGYDPAGHFAGRQVTAYRQEDPGGTVVDWYVVLDRDAQLSVGCRHTPAGAEAVRAACAVVVASVRAG
ncbi:type VII secretion-associated protein (TIGR03931 family) [Pseudonocardia hierapolitana]|uniref:Type VII secretion-associated protein (TIGR03931 family) n=1 Tax=Pseudonocardia hierapolitana TaxID=1128676 RepID=A0A561SU23_9PSEU|nr:type VII secretion-associated protein [Pseudonocardia hierapolitana]TWF78368.1 type VII secretion-associated protein (TIGR03931 family) [Pseudonocardia hierapolitana]